MKYRVYVKAIGIVTICLLAFFSVEAAADVNTNTLWYLAEGSTAYGFNTWVLVQNPQSTDASVTFTFMKSDGTTVTHTTTVSATSRYSLNVNSFVPDEPGVSTKVECTNSKKIIAERAMYWAAGGGHCSIGATGTSPNWYLAEGCTRNFDEYILIQNPNTSSADVTVTFMKEDGTTVVETMVVGASSRYTIYVNNILPDEVGVSAKIESADDLGVVVERAMYWATGGGHCSLGEIATNTTWYLAEGSTSGYDEWVLIQNPNTTDAEVTVTFMKSDGTTVSQPITVNATSRYSINVNRVVPDETGVSTKIVSDNGIGLIAERAMYWASGGGHCSIGISDPGTTWYLAEGSTSGYSTWVLIQNPNDSAATATVTFMRSDGSTVTQDITVNATSRYTIYVNAVLPNETGVSTKIAVANSIGVIAERAMYWATFGGHCSIGAKHISDPDDGDDGGGDGDGTPPSEPATIFCFGDSLTEGYPYQGESTTYPAYLQVMLDNAYGSGLYTVTNYGDTGKRADEILAMIQSEGWLNEDPDIVLLLAGGNDLTQDITGGYTINQAITRTIEDMQDIVNLVKAHTNGNGSAPQLIVSVTLPTTSALVTAFVVSPYNTSLQASLTGMDLFITTNWTDFYDEANSKADETLMSDTIHANEAGYQVMAENWKEAIDNL